MSPAEVECRVEAARERLTQHEGGKRALRAIEAHGGLAAWDRAPTSSHVWTYANTDADLPQTFFDYADYVTVDGLTVPNRFAGYTYSATAGIGDTLRNEAFADSISYRRPFDASKLKRPADARFVSMPGELRKHTVGSKILYGSECPRLGGSRLGALRCSLWEVR